MSRRSTAMLALFALGLLAAPAVAKKHDGAPKVHAYHCEIGGVEVDKTKKDCRKADGVWQYGPPRIPAQPTAAPPSTPE